MVEKLAIGTRFFGKDPAKDLPRLDAYIKRALSVVSDPANVLIAVNVDQDQAGALEHVMTHYPGVQAFPVTPWGKFVLPLNAIVLMAGRLGAKQLLLASAEYPPHWDAVEALQFHMTHSDTCMVGAALPEHDFKPGPQLGNGRTIPWNTFNLLNMRHLAVTGFPMLGDAVFEPGQVHAGVEELATAALIQAQHGASVKLIYIEGFAMRMNTEGWDKERFEAHEKKMRSKMERPAEQLGFAGIKPPRVEHIVHR